MKRICSVAVLAMLSACSSGDTAPSADPVAVVSLGAAESGAISQTVTLYGAIEADAATTYILSTPAEAIVVEVASPAGTAVRAGQTVVRLTATPGTAAEFAKASADATAAKQALARAERLRTDGLASDADVEAARAASAAAVALEHGMQTKSASLTLRAKDAGSVESVSVKPGDLVSTGAVVASLSRSGPRRARFGAPPGVARQLRPGAMLRIAPAGGDRAFDAPLTAVATTIDPQTRLAAAYAEIPAGRGMNPGQPLRAEAPIASASSALTIPYAALLDDGGQPYVFVVEGDIAHRHDVVTGPSGGERIVIVKGLAAGARVVTKGATALEDGMKVRVQ